MKYDLAKLMQEALRKNENIYKTAQTQGLSPEHFEEYWGESFFSFLNEKVYEWGGETGSPTGYLFAMLIQSLGDNPNIHKDKMIKLFGRNDGKIDSIVIRRRLTDICRMYNREVMSLVPKQQYDQEKHDFDKFIKDKFLNYYLVNLDEETLNRFVGYVKEFCETKQVPQRLIEELSPYMTEE